MTKKTIRVSDILGFDDAEIIEIEDVSESEQKKETEYDNTKD